ncbi:pupal cuticle protein Edg-84A-like [Palaemon carinicauda]|uniref:pupal cuticle protein Edg-84A-like n=1 Tax=Palaemon carinicauda TaxID=392227 RepID=UPI0035B59DB4
MNAKVILVVLGLAAMVAADSSESFEYAPRRRASSEESYESSEARYSFNWAVDHDPSSNEFGHQESRDGDETQGSYYVELPDGRLQTVKYFVNGDSGYVAEVNHEDTSSAESVESYERPRYRYSSDSNESK